MIILYPSSSFLAEFESLVEERKNFVVRVKGKVRASVVRAHFPFLFEEELNPPLFKTIIRQFIILELLAAYGKAFSSKAYRHEILPGESNFVDIRFEAVERIQSSKDC